MAPQAWTTNTADLTPDPPGYQVDDLLIDLAPRRVRRAATVIPLKSLSFDLLVTLVRAAPGLVSFEQLSERVWPGLVVTPETIVQRVKLLRSALGDDPHAPRYIEGVRGRGYRMVAEVRPLTDTTVTEAATASAASATPPAPPRPAAWGPLGWIGGTLSIVVLLAASWALVHYWGASNPAERTSPDGAPAAIRSLAVLPLENLSGDKEQEYFADGMTDALTTDLAQIGSLRVISRTSAMRFKGSKESLPQIGRDLQVDAVVEGTVTRSAGRVRITAQLIEASKDHHLWARSYERDLKDVLSLQDEIARDVTAQIRVELTPKERSLLMQAHTADPEAQDDYLRGRYWNSLMTPEGAQKGLDYSQQAVAKDSSYALAYAGVAESYFLLGLTGALPWEEAYPKQKDAAIKALALDPSLAEAHASLAQVRWAYDWDWSGAKEEFRQAIDLRPNYALAHTCYSAYLLVMERVDEAVKESEQARDLDPFSATTVWWLGQTLYHARRYDDALRQNRLGLEIYPDNVSFYEAMADVYEQKKMFAEAYGARVQALKLRNYPTLALDEAYQRSGYDGYLRRLIAILEHVPPQQLCPGCLIHQYALLGDEAHAMTWLERAYAERRSEAVLFIRTAPELDSIRSSARFRDLVRRIGFPQPPNAKN